MFVGKAKTPKVSPSKSLLSFPLPAEPPSDPSHQALSYKYIIIIITVVLAVAVFMSLIFHRRLRHFCKSPPLWHIPVFLL